MIKNYVIYVCIQISKVHPHTALKIIYNLIYCFVLSTTICDNFVFGQYYTVKEKIMHLQTFDEKPLHYGYFLGFNNFGYQIQYNSNYFVPNNRNFPNNKRGLNLPNIELTKNTGFNVGLIGDLRLNKYFNLRLEPGLYYTQRDLIYPEATSGLTNDEDFLREVKSTYIHIPLLVKFSAKRINNFKPYLVAGLSTSFNLSSNEKNNDDNYGNVFRVTSQSFNYEIGFGIDFYLVYFKFSPSIRGIFSFQNELIQDNNLNSPWTSNIKSLLSQGFAINLTFE